MSDTQWGQTDMLELGEEKGLFMAMQADRWLRPQTPWSILAKLFSGQGEEGAWLVLADFLMSGSFVLVAVHLGPVRMFL